jgi:hypothetical protein
MRASDCASKSQAASVGLQIDRDATFQDVRPIGRIEDADSPAMTSKLGLWDLRAEATEARLIRVRRRR